MSRAVSVSLAKLSVAWVAEFVPARRTPAKANPSANVANERKRKLAAAVKRHHKRLRSQLLPKKMY